MDIIFPGCQLPDMDGPNFTRKIRSLPGHKKTPLIAISDSPDDERKEAAKSAGGTGWMVPAGDAREIDQGGRGVRGAH